MVDRCRRGERGNRREPSSRGQAQEAKQKPREPVNQSVRKRRKEDVMGERSG